MIRLNKFTSNNSLYFYIQELKKKFFPDTFLIERIIKKNKNGFSYYT